jgi:16S rRNA (cytosine1402-N4)-methyltransferase
MPGGQLLGIDLDPKVVDHARQRLQHHQSSYVITQGSYTQMEELAASLGFTQLDGILLDLGMSSFQLGTPGRGFSLLTEEPLDMRYDPEGELTADHMVNTYSLDRLATILSQLGEEPRARSIARAIVEQRPLATTLELANLVMKAYGGRRGRTHPATRTFQALRIAVNSELDNVRAGLFAAINLLRPGGRLVVISYHSLEDRIVKGILTQESRGCICPPNIPVCSCEHIASLKVRTKKIIIPTPEEVRGNPRSRSARLRAAERLPGA